MIANFLTLDGSILIWIQENLRGVMDSFMVFYTHLGDGGVLWLAICVVMCIFSETRRTGYMALSSMAFGVICTNVILKNVFNRVRPYEVVSGLSTLIGAQHDSSFPSGHTTAAFAVAMIVARYAPERWMIAGVSVLAILMAFSRLYVGVHYPSDIIGGILVGIFCAWLSVVFEKKLMG